MRRRARLRSTHFSTRIEGNRLTLAEAEKVIESRRVLFKGHEKADLTKWVEYFLGTVANVFKTAKEEATALQQGARARQAPELRGLDPRARVVLGLFVHADRISAPQAAKALGLSDRMIRLTLAGWVREGMLTVLNPSNRKRTYGLSEKYRHIIGNPKL